MQLVNMTSHALLSTLLHAITYSQYWATALPHLLSTCCLDLLARILLTFYQGPVLQGCCCQFPSSLVAHAPPIGVSSVYIPECSHHIGLMRQQVLNCKPVYKPTWCAWWANQTIPDHTSQHTHLAHCVCTQYTTYTHRQFIMKV